MSKWLVRCLSFRFVNPVRDSPDSDSSLKNWLPDCQITLSGCTEIPGAELIVLNIARVGSIPRQHRPIVFFELDLGSGRGQVVFPGIHQTRLHGLSSSVLSLLQRLPPLPGWCSGWWKTEFSAGQRNHLHREVECRARLSPIVAMYLRTQPPHTPEVFHSQWIPM